MHSAGRYNGVHIFYLRKCTLFQILLLKCTKKCCRCVVADPFTCFCNGHPASDKFYCSCKAVHTKICIPYRSY